MVALLMPWFTKMLEEMKVSKTNTESHRTHSRAHLQVYGIAVMVAEKVFYSIITALPEFLKHFMVC